MSGLLWSGIPQWRPSSRPDRVAQATWTAVAATPAAPHAANIADAEALLRALPALRGAGAAAPAAAALAVAAVSGGGTGQRAAAEWGGRGPSAQRWGSICVCPKF